MPQIPFNLDTLLIDAVDSMVIVTDDQGRIVRFNLGGQRLMGYAPVEVMGRPLWEVFPAPEFRERTRSRFRMLMAGESLRIDANWLTKSGERKHLACTCVGVTGPSGEIEFTMGTGVDMTERVATERALRESESRFRTTFDDAAIGMALVDECGKYLHVNRAFCELTGYTVEELLHLDLLKITHPDDRERNREYLEKLFKREIPGYALEKRYIRRNGELVWVNVSASIASGNEGQPSTIIGLFENISARKKTEAALGKAYDELRLLNETLEERVTSRTAELEARTDELDRSKQTLLEQRRILRSVLDSMGDGVVVTDGAGNLMLINPTAERITGPATTTSIEKRSQRPFYFRADGQTRLTSDEVPIIRSLRGESLDDVEILIRRPNLPDTWTSATARPLVGENGKPEGAVVVFRDVTDRKRHEAELEEANASLERANASLRESEGHYRDLAESHLRLAREVEHRVRNNLQGLLGLLSVMRDRTTDVATFADAMESRLAGMQHVHQLLAQARWKGVGMRTLIDGALTTLRHMSCFPVEIQMTGPDITIGSQQVLPLTLILVEWFTNSCKYGVHSQAGGRLDILWSTVGDATPPRVRLQWIERGGPRITGPLVPSLGTELITGFSRRGLSGSVEMRYPPEGADHVLEFTVRDEVFVPPESGE